jgi:hypothetical protein
VSPRSRGGWFEAKPRIAVEGGVAVPKPGKVTHPAALDILHAAEVETSAAILGRGRTYARAGQVLGLEADDQGFSARIQGSARRPYTVRLAKVVISGSDRIDATCTCPYGCDYGWCKHAAALAYVAAFLVDTQPATRAVWVGEQPTQELAELEASDIAVLKSSPPWLTFAQRVAAASDLVPWPQTPDQRPTLALVHDATSSEHQPDSPG